MIAEAEQIQLEGFAFHHFFPRNIAYVYGGKIRLPGHRAQAGKFGADEFDEIIVVGMLIVECFQNFRRIFGFVLSVLIAEQRDAPQLFRRTRHRKFLSFLLWEDCEPQFAKRRIVNHSGLNSNRQNVARLCRIA